ncbi:MAG: OmpA family protein [Candidatus Kapabacteria bacterium]|nr:OmpA family protein [Candidatus Kapabacteria bacterium]
MKKAKLYLLISLFSIISALNVLLSQEIISEQLEYSRRYIFPFGNENDSKLSDSMKKLLDMMILVVKEKNSNLRIKIDSHAFSLKIKSDKLQKLSEDRAMNAVRYITSKGLTKAKVLYRGYGDRMPILDAALPESIQRNNRIEFMVVEK